MGWLSMTAAGMGEHKTPKQYLDAQLNYTRPATDDNPFQGCRVLKSICPGNKTYYAAIERFDENGTRIYVTAVVCLVQWNPRAADGYIFGYKDMDEESGPVEAEASEAILELLTSSKHPWALDWRRRCYRNLKLKKRELPDGCLIRFPSPMKFTDGSEHSEFRVKKEGRKTVMVPPSGYGRFHVSRLMERHFEIVREPKIAKTFFPAA